MVFHVSHGSSARTNGKCETSVHFLEIIRSTEFPVTFDIFFSFFSAPQTKMCQ